MPNPAKEIWDMITGVFGKPAGGAIPPDEGIEEMLASLDTAGTREVPNVDMPVHLSGKEDYIAELYRQSGKYGIDPKLMQSMMEIESGYDPDAVSDVGAIGLMQIMPNTAKGDLGIDEADLYDPRTNIEGGVRYANILINEYIPTEAKRAGVSIPINTETVSAAYHMGARGLAEHIKNSGDKWRETLKSRTKEHIRRMSDTYASL